MNKKINHPDLLIILVLMIGTFVIYWQVHTHGFVDYDDHDYIIENPHVRAGLTMEGLIWASTSRHAANWHPLTWLSHMLDCELYGLDPKGHHLSNLFFHMANTLLLFFLLTAMTGARYQSAFVVGLFALHPLHVESVAWVAERKDLLSTFFGFLTVWSYTRHVKRPGLLPYLRTSILFTLGLICKPMLVTLPFLLLLIDYWPLRRVERVTSRPFLHLIWEKWPLFLLSLASCIITFQVQQGWGAIKTLGTYPFDVRIANALIAYVSYMGKMVWPQGLSVLYPHTGQMPPLWQIGGASLFLILGSVLVVRMARHHAYLPVGWFWYLGTLFPVMGLIQVGFQKMADRYTYLSLIGLFIIIAWGIPELVGKCRYRKWLFILLSLV
ncbi:MAG: hypothetical protein ABIG67_09325, partial [Pseudomonadota bacterium]